MFTYRCLFENTHKELKVIYLHADNFDDLCVQINQLIEPEWLLLEVVQIVAMRGNR